VGTAPGFILEQAGKVVISLPGVPKEMEWLTQATVIPFIQSHWLLHSVIRTRVIHVAGIGEAQLDDLIGEFEKTSNPTVGLLAKSGVVDIRIGAKAETISEADSLIEGYIQKLQAILGDHIVGYDQTTLLDTVITLARQQTFPLVIISEGFNGKIYDLLGGKIPDHLRVTEITNGWQVRPEDDQHPTISLHGRFDQHPAELRMVLHINGKEKETIRKFAGPPENGISWGINTSLDYIRRYLLGVLVD